jgi:hypothetical protein
MAVSGWPSRWTGLSGSHPCNPRFPCVSAAGSLTFVQNGCEVQYTVPEINGSRGGVIVGNRMRLSGPFLLPVPDADVRFNENLVTIEGTVTANRMSLMGTGRSSGSVDGIGFRCDGMSTAEGSR